MTEYIQVLHRNQPHPKRMTQDIHPKVRQCKAQRYSKTTKAPSQLAGSCREKQTSGAIIPHIAEGFEW